MIMLLLSIVIFFSPTRTYIFHMFGFVWGGIAFFTFTHCFFVLPILLTLVGPRSAEVDDMADSCVKMMDAHDPGIKVGSEVKFEAAGEAEMSGSWAQKIEKESSPDVPAQEGNLESVDMDN